MKELLEKMLKDDRLSNVLKSEYLGYKTLKTSVALKKIATDYRLNEGLRADYCDSIIELSRKYYDSELLKLAEEIKNYNKILENFSDFYEENEEIFKNYTPQGIAFKCFKKGITEASIIH